MENVPLEMITEIKGFAVRSQWLAFSIPTQLKLIMIITIDYNTVKLKVITNTISIVNKININKRMVHFDLSLIHLNKIKMDLRLNQPL